MTDPFVIVTLTKPAECDFCLQMQECIETPDNHMACPDCWQLIRRSFETDLDNSAPHRSELQTQQGV